MKKSLVNIIGCVLLVGLMIERSLTMRKRHVNEYIHTSFADSGRIAGMGINEDNYGHDAAERKYHHKPGFIHEDVGNNGEVITYCKGQQVV